MDDKYKKLVDTLPKESEDLWFEYNLAVNKIIQENHQLKEQLENNDCKTIYNQFVNYKNWYFDYLDKYEKVKQENKELHNKIDKAIEYINKRMILEQAFCLDMKQCYELTEILKDSDVDE